jgi:hypothetical protein
MIETTQSVEPLLSIADVNDRIKKEVCKKTISELTDQALMTEYKQSPSVKKEIIKLGNIFEKHGVDEETKKKIIDDEEFLLTIIPAGTKGVVRGNTFNSIVKNFITELALDGAIFEVCFEKECDSHPTDEKPDWYILEKSTKKVIIGMNQLDLWGGGQQLNRGFKYIFNPSNDTNTKLLCVVCNEIQLKNTNKAYKLFATGFANNTLCYLNNLENIITSFF